MIFFLLAFGAFLFVEFAYPEHQRLVSLLDDMEEDISKQIRTIICSELGVDEKRITKAIEAREKIEDRTPSDGWSALNEIFFDPERFLK